MRRLLLFLLVTACAPLPQGVLAARQRMALQRHDWFEAVQLGRARVAGSAFDIGARYDLACALARAGDDAAALQTLAEAIALGYDDASWLERDEDLQSLRGRAELSALRAEARRVAREGISVPGTRVLVRDTLSTPIRLRLPEAPPAGRPARPPVALPSAAQASPVVLFFGSEDPALTAWRAALPGWRARGLPCSTRVLPGRDHELLFDEALLEAELAALPPVSAGE
jgi:hypothetical protein